MGNGITKKKGLLKIICFFLLPILIGGIILFICELVFIAEYPESKTSVTYYESESFCSSYLNSICYNYILSDYESRAVAESSEAYKTGDGTVIHYINNTYNYYDDYMFLLYDKNTNTAYTNLNQTTKTDTIQKIINELSNNGLFWNMIEDEVHTNIERLGIDYIKYDDAYKRIQQKVGTKELYTSYNIDTQYHTTYLVQNYLFHIANKTYKFVYILLPLFIIISIIMSIYLIIMTGKTRKKEGIYLDWFDKIPLELAGVLGGIALTIEFFLTFGTVYLIEYNIIFYFIIEVLLAYIGALNLLYLIGSIIKRIKSKTFIKNSFIYTILIWLKNNIVGIYESLVYNMNNTLRVIIMFGLIVVISSILINLDTFGILLLMAFWGYCIYFIIKRLKEFNTIKEALKNIYEGKENVQVKEQDLKGILKEIAFYINDISGGLSNAIQENLKSERLKTELITNVSHDLKTPLTSIINYVDLLKKENIQDEKIKEYIHVLDQKSQRLKKLTEDLVEASKASSGNIKLNKEKLNVKELIKQLTGEFEDKFKEKQLETITNFGEDDIYIFADSRYMYRVMENLFSNVSKYALIGSRVYIDILKNNGKILLSIKNISNDKLNITADELMQRFVRGDSSRNTEGSGLGLSIAQTLTQIQDGTFDINIDGDLFKIIIEFNEM